MARWILKAAIQRTIGLMPRRHVWNGLFQEYVTKSTRLDIAAFERHLKLDARHLDHFYQHTPTGDADPITAFELGTGWYPILPIAFFLCGAGNIWTCDITPLMKLRHTLETVQLFIACHDRGALKELVPRLKADRVEHLRSVAAKDWPGVRPLLETMNIHLLVGDAAQSGLPAESVDLIVSNVVLEYIPDKPLGAILREFRRVASQRSVLSHDIDMSDQYSHFDGSITPFNFLRFSDKAWRIINNPLIPLSRLRISDYRRLFREAGFDLVEEDLERGAREDLERVPLAKPFLGYPVDDLLVLRAWLVAQSSGSSATMF